MKLEDYERTPELDSLCKEFMITNEDLIWEMGFMPQEELLPMLHYINPKLDQYIGELVEKATMYFEIIIDLSDVFSSASIVKSIREFFDAYNAKYGIYKIQAPKPILTTKDLSIEGIKPSEFLRSVICDLVETGKQVIEQGLLNSTPNDEEYKKYKKNYLVQQSMGTITAFMKYFGIPISSSGLTKENFEDITSFAEKFVKKYGERDDI